MGTAVDFNTWLLQPGNHRQLRSLRDKLKDVLHRKVEIRSWMELYSVFEESVLKNGTTRALFSGVIDVCPPSEDSGASKNQILLYRGAKVGAPALPAEKHTKQVTYRGQTIEKLVDVGSADDSAAKAGKPLRYYRGAPVK